MSDLVNEAVKLSLAEDAEDLAAFEERAGEPGLSFESVVKDLKRYSIEDEGLVVIVIGHRKDVDLPGAVTQSSRLPPLQSGGARV